MLKGRREALASVAVPPVFSGAAIAVPSGTTAAEYCTQPIWSVLSVIAASP
jgi:hypothetical protein